MSRIRSSSASSRRKDVATLQFCISPDDVVSFLDLKIVKESAPPDIRDFTASYYDFPDRLLQGQGYSLSIEKATRRRRRQVVRKTAADFAARTAPDEYGVSVKRNTPDWNAFEGRPYANLLPVVPEAKEMVCLFTVRVKRYSWKLETEGGAAVHMTLDSGYIETNGKTKDICVLKLAGADIATRFSLAKQISAHIPVQLEMLTYAEHGFNLLKTEAEAVTRPGRMPVHGAQTPAQAFQAIARMCLKHLLANVAVFDGEARQGVVHQVRVAIRRLRVAFDLFRDVLDDPLRNPLRAELGWMARELGNARSTDVYIDEVLRPEAARFEGNQEFATLFDEYRQRQQQAHEMAGHHLKSARFFRALLTLGEWIETGSWLRAQNSQQNVSMGAFSAAQLSRYWRRVRREGKRLNWKSDEAIHEWRLTFKKMRYAADYFGVLYGLDKASSNIPHRAAQFLAAIQGGLGQLNDTAEMMRLNRLSSVAGIIHQEYAQMRPDITREVGRHYRALRVLLPYWENPEQLDREVDDLLAGILDIPQTSPDENQELPQDPGTGIFEKVNET